MPETISRHVAGLLLLAARIQQADFTSLNRSLKEWPRLPLLRPSDKLTPTLMIPPSSLDFSLLERHSCWSKCGRRTRQNLTLNLHSARRLVWSPLRASSDHCFIVGALRAQRPYQPPRYSLLRARVPGAQDQRGCPSHPFHRARSASKKNTWPLPSPHFNVSGLTSHAGLGATNTRTLRRWSVWFFTPCSSPAGAIVPCPGPSTCFSEPT